MNNRLYYLLVMADDRAALIQCIQYIAQGLNISTFRLDCQGDLRNTDGFTFVAGLEYDVEYLALIIDYIGESYSAQFTLGELIFQNIYDIYLHVDLPEHTDALVLESIDLSQQDFFIGEEMEMLQWSLKDDEELSYLYPL